MQQFSYRRGGPLYILILLGLCFTGTNLLSQTVDSDTHVDTVHIAAARLNALTPGHRRVIVDSIALQQTKGQNLSDLLSLHSDIFVKSYGLGSLATTSLRGGGASHTAVIWNGFSLQSSMNGQLDFSLVPVFFLDQVELQYGGSTALYGSGAMGGAVHLSNESQFGKGLKAGLHLQTGSFQDQMGGIDIGWSAKNWQSRTRAFTHRASNDFLLPDKTRRQPHAAYQQSGLLQEFAIKTGKDQVLQLWIWKLESEREIPPPLTNEASFADQSDQSLRVAAAWNKSGDRLNWQARTAYLQSDLFFQDSMAGIDADNWDRSLIQEVESEWIGNKQHRIRLGVTHSFQQARADGYGENLAQQQRIALFSAWQWTSPSQGWESVLSVRREWMQGWEIPLVPSLSLRGRITSWVQIRGQVGRTFRIPTFNNLFWSPGGNPDLLPESGWHQELGFNGQGGIQKLKWEVDLTGFSQNINHWILWRPGPSFWFPENLRNVWSRGIEANGNLQRGWKQWKAELQLAYTYTRATITQVEQSRDLSLGKQLIYTPEHQARSLLRLQYQHLAFTYSHRLTGKRYTSTDNEFSIPAFDLASARIGYVFTSKHLRGDCGIQLNNLWNQSYQIIENRAMPFRSVQFSLNIEYLSKP